MNMEFRDSRLCLRLPVDVALRNGFAQHGVTEFVLTDDVVRAIPPELRGELAQWVDQTERYGESPPELMIDAPAADVPTVVRALQASVDARRAGELTLVLGLPDNEFQRETANRGLETEPRVAARMALIHQARAAKALIRESIRVYASGVPYLKRAAMDPAYPIAPAALDHLVGSIAAFDADAMTLTSRSAEFQNAKIEVRKGGSPYAFGVRDKILDHVEKIPRPSLVEIAVDPISRYRRAVKGTHRGVLKWTLDQPVTVVPVRVVSQVEDDRYVLFFADEDDRQRALMGGDDDIPF